MDGFFFSSRRRHTRCGRDWSSDVCSSDLLAAPRWTQCSAKVENAPVVNIKSRYRKMTFRLVWFFLETDRLAFGVEFHDPVALRVAHLISKNTGAALDGQSVPVEVEFTVKNVIA